MCQRMIVGLMYTAGYDVHYVNMFLSRYCSKKYVMTDQYATYLLFWIDSPVHICTNKQSLNMVYQK